jgi:hypothetical protein
LLKFVNHQSMKLLLISSLIVLSGCEVLKPREKVPELVADTRIMSRAYPAKDIHKLKSAQVLWVEDRSIYYTILKTAPGIKPTITDEDKLVAQEFVNEFKKTVIAKTREQLKISGVSDGKEMLIELTPTESYFNISDGTRNLLIKATLKKPGAAQESWNIMILTLGPKTASTETLRNNYISKLVAELKEEGWISK